MKVCNVDRNTFYRVLNALFLAFDIKPLIAELGVLRGNNALSMYSALSPQKMVLIDSWSPDANEAYCAFETLPPWVEPIETYADYYGGPMHEQKTWDALYHECATKFANMPNVTLIRSSTIDAIEQIKPLTGIDQFDLVYIDANHQYEYILRDLMYYQNLVAPEGFMMLNDCCFSPSGTLQNLGVLEALSSFIKRSNFIPVALTNTDWSDVILVRKGSQMEIAVDTVFTQSDIPFVDVPHPLISAARVIYGKQRTNISFC